MADKDAPVVAQTPAIAADIPLSLDEFCRRASTERNTPELLSAFAHTERDADRLNDTHAAYAARYVEFANAPA